MREIETQTPDGARWFQGDALDLFVWDSETDVVASLQLTVSSGAEEHAFLWSEAEGVRIATVDSGTRPGKYPATPTFQDSRDVDLRALLGAFDEQSVYIDPRVRTLVLDLLRKASDAVPAEPSDRNMTMTEASQHRARRLHGHRCSGRARGVLRRMRAPPAPRRRPLVRLRPLDPTHGVEGGAAQTRRVTREQPRS